MSGGVPPFMRYTVTVIRRGQPRAYADTLCVEEVLVEQSVIVVVGGERSFLGWREATIDDYAINQALRILGLADKPRERPRPFGDNDTWVVSASADPKRPGVVIVVSQSLFYD